LLCKLNILPGYGNEVWGIVLTGCSISHHNQL